MPTNNFIQLLNELKRRKVFRVIAMYAATAFIIMEAADIMLPRFGLPDWTVTFIIILLIVGFPITIILSWIFDITPEGLMKTEPVKDEGKKIVSPKSGSKIFNPNNMIITILFIVVCVLLYPKIFKKTNLEGIREAEIKSIAVLPLSNQNKNDEQLEYFSDGVTQEIIDELAKVHRFQLSAFSSTALYKGTDKSLKTIALELGVSFILTGRSRIYSDSVRLSIELINPETGNRIWSKRYDDVLSNAIKIQNDIARQVAAELNIELSPEETIGLARINTNNHEAFDLLLQAKAEYAKLTEVALSRSINMLERAIELDPNYAQAYTLLAWIYVLNGNPEIVGNPDNSVIIAEKIQFLIDKAISLNPSISDNYLILGALDLFYLNDLPGALKHVNTSLDMSSWPKVPTNYCICVVISTYAAIGKLEEATEIVNLSKKIDRSNEFVFNDEGIILLLKGEFDQAIYSFRQAVAFKDIPGFNFYLGWAYYHREEFENALLHLDKAVNGAADPLGLALAFLSNTHFKMGNVNESNHYRDIMVKRQSSGKTNLNIPLAMISAARGKTEEALYFLDKAYKEKDFGFAYYLNADPVFDELKSNIRFIELNKNLGFDQY